MWGYRLVISLLQTKADTKLEVVIDNEEYDEADLIEMRVSLNMPYQNRYTDFERHYGEINIDGKVYSYVKSKVEGDVLVLKCIANKSRQQLKTTFDNLVKSNTGQDQETNNGKKQTSSFKSFSTDYDDKNQFYNIAISDIANRIQLSGYLASLSDVLILTPHQPPKG